MKAEWRYEDLQQKLWSVENITDVWGIGRRTAIRLNRWAYLLCMTWHTQITIS